MRTALKLFLKNLMIMTLLTTAVFFTSYFVRRLMGSDSSLSIRFVWMAIGIASVGMSIAVTIAQIRK
jgi:hypothetical protein